MRPFNAKIGLKKISFWLILLILAFAILELTCYAAFKSLKKRFYPFDFNNYLANEIDIKQASMSLNQNKLILLSHKNKLNNATIRVQ